MGRIIVTPVNSKYKTAHIFIGYIRYIKNYDVTKTLRHKLKSIYVLFV